VTVIPETCPNDGAGTALCFSRRLWCCPTEHSCAGCERGGDRAVLEVAPLGYNRGI
jgi:hypothetical protein